MVVKRRRAGTGRNYYKQNMSGAINTMMQPILHTDSTISDKNGAMQERAR